MSTVKPPPPLSTAAPRPAPSAPLALAVRASDAVRALNVGQSLEATRLISAPSATPAKGTVQVQTILGPITLQTAYPIPKGAILSLVLIQQGQQPQFQITAINAKPVATTPKSSTATQHATVLAKPLAPGQTLNATLLRPAFTSPQQTRQLPVTPSTILSSASSINPQSAPETKMETKTGTKTETNTATKPGSESPAVKASRASPPSSKSVPTNKSVLPNVLQNARTTPQRTMAPNPDIPLQNQPAARSTSQIPKLTPNSAKGTSSNVLPTGTRLRVTVQRIDAPNAAVSTPILNLEKEPSTALTARSILTGTLTGSTQQGQPIVQTPSALFALETRTTSVDGTRLTLRLDSTPQPPSLATPFSIARSDDLTSIANWSNLNEALRALAAVDPQRLTQVANRALPQVGAKLGTQMLFFLSALKGGEIRSLFGDTAARLIEKKRPGLLKRLNGDLHTMAKHTDQGDWRLALIPMWSGTQLEQVRFYWRHANAHDTVEEDSEETRFVLDVDLSRMGHLQIDGLLKTKHQHMDLIVRTDTPLPVEWRRDITEIFNQGHEITGFNGSVAFQAVPANFVQFPTTQTAEFAPGLYA